MKQVLQILIASMLFAASPAPMVISPQLLCSDEIEKIRDGTAKDGKGLTADEIKTVISANGSHLRQCYETLLKKYPKAEGKVRVGFVVDANGAVNHACISKETTLIENVFHQCFIGKIKSWKFPKPKGSPQVKIRYPFTFQPM